MFDWNDEEITNIIWGEAGVSDDHIVPYPNGSEIKPSGPYVDQSHQEQNEAAANVKPAEKKKPASTVTYFNEVKLEGSSQNEKDEILSAKGLGMESSPSNAKSDQGVMKKESSDNLAESSKHDSSRRAGGTAHHYSAGGTAQLDSSSNIFPDQQEREQGDFVECGWANIGSFDDLDRIFSNDDPLFGHASLSNADELWSSSKDVTSNPEKSKPLYFDSQSLAVEALTDSSDQFEIRSEYTLHQDPSASGKLTVDSSNIPQNTVGYAGGKNKSLQKKKTALEAGRKSPAFNSDSSAGIFTMPEFVDKENRRRRLLKSVKPEEKREVRQLQDACGTWSTFASQQYARTIGNAYQPFVMNHERQLLRPSSSQYRHFSGPLLASSMHANMATQYPPMAVLSQLPSGNGFHQKMVSGYEVSPANSDPLNRASDPPLQPLPMTPKEKIEKLRRRQQMRAMLAIQKQQQQFNNHASTTKQPTLEGAKREVNDNLKTLPSIDPIISLDQEDPNTICIPPEYPSVEDSILYHLQDIIGKLDIRIRICIRDSLFRLAQSAVQRQLSSDTSSINTSSRVQVFEEEQSNNQNRFTRMPDVETETNPIDRTVAHLLFHRPLESSGKQAARLELPLSAKLSCERKDPDLFTSPKAFLHQSSENEKILSDDESKVSFLLPEENQLQNSLFLDTSNNGSDNEAADSADLEADASK